MNPTGRAPNALEQALTGLSESLTGLGQEVRGLREDVQAGERRRRRNNVLMGAGLVVVLLLVGMLAVVSLQNRRVLDSTSQTNATMADCTTPGGRCYEEGRRRTADAIDNILKVSIYMAECARLYPNEAGPTYDKKLEACIYERLARPAPTPAPGRGG